MLNLINVRADSKHKQLLIAKELPRLRSFFIAIESVAFGEGEARASEFTNCPWIDSGVLQQIASHSDNPYAFIRPQLEAMYNDMPVDSGVLTLRVENNGSSPCQSLIVHADVIDVPNGGKRMRWNSNEFDPPVQRADEFQHGVFAAGDLEPGKALILPLYVYAYLGQQIEPPRVAFGHVIFPRVIECTNVLGGKERQDVRQRFTTPLRLTAHLAGKG